MNIYSKRGEKVFFTGIGGHPYQLEEAKKIFSVGQELTIDDIDVDSSFSSVKFKEHDEWFNTVMFENTKAVVMNTRENPTLRDQFAMAALTGIIPFGFNDMTSTAIAAFAYAYADAMMTERDK